MSQPPSVPLIDLHAQYTSIRAEIDAATQRVLESGWYILGREVSAFEQEFTDYLRRCSGEHAPPASDTVLECVGVNSGTDALHLALLACGVEPGDEVITVSHTAVATAAAISLAGARPVFVDIDSATYTMDPAALEAALSRRTAAILPVHLYGHPADMDAIMAVAQQAGLPVIEDCAQAHGALYRGRAVGTIGDVACFSFYPTKNLGAFGDGGAVVSRKPRVAERVRRLREYGWTAQARYVSQERGLNSRLDEMQAAILRAKLAHLDAWNEVRRQLAKLYDDLLGGSVTTPAEAPDCRHVYHLYVIRTAARHALRRSLQAAGIGTGIHYPAPIHLQPAYAGAAAPGSLPVTERVASEILSLPMYPHLTRPQVEQVAAAVHSEIDAIKAGETAVADK